MNLVDTVREKLESAIHQVLFEIITPNVNEHLITDDDGEEYVLIFGKKADVIRDDGLVKRLLNEE